MGWVTRARQMTGRRNVEGGHHLRALWALRGPEAHMPTRMWEPTQIGAAPIPTCITILCSKCVSQQMIQTPGFVQKPKLIYNF